MTPAGNGPTLAGDVVVVGSPLSGLDPADGSVRWQIDADSDVVGRPGYDAARNSVVAALRHIDGSNITVDLVSVDAKTGAEQWRVPLPGHSSAGAAVG